MHGQFVWYELMTSDADAARKFYAPITGWGTQPFDAQYTMWTSGGTPIGGLQALGPKEREQRIPPHWLPYIESSNVAETTRVASSLGAKIIEGPREIPGAGTFAIIQDPQSAFFGVYDPKGRPGAWDGTPIVGRFSWHELMTTDRAKAFEFYRRLFGWEETSQMDMGGGNMYQMYGQGRQPYGGIFTRPPEMAGMPPFWLCYINVKDVHKAVATATKNGAFVQRPPMEIPGGGTIAILGDPQGAAFAVHGVGTSATEQRPGAAKKGGAAKKVGTAKKAGAGKKPAAGRKVSAGKKAGAAKKRGAAKGSAAKKRSATKKRGATKARTANKRGATKKRSTRTKRRRATRSR
jgi:uncharacterized protein